MALEKLLKSYWKKGFLLAAILSVGTTISDVYYNSSLEKNKESNYIHPSRKFAIELYNSKQKEQTLVLNDKTEYTIKYNQNIRSEKP